MADNRIVLATSPFVVFGSGQFAQISPAVITRYGADGNLDLSFGDSGSTTVSAEETGSVAVQGDGRILVPEQGPMGSGIAKKFNVLRLEGDRAVTHLLVTGSDVGDVSRVRVFDATTGDQLGAFAPFVSTFKGGVRVATGDVNGDSFPDIIVGMGGATGALSRVRVIDGHSVGGTLVDLVGTAGTGFVPFNLNTTGVNVAVGDVDGDGRNELIFSQDGNNSPLVRIFKVGSSDLPPQPLTLVASFSAFPNTYRGGVRIAAGDVTGDGKDDIIVTRSKGTPDVRVFDGATRRQLRGNLGQFNAFPTASARHGLYVDAAGDHV